MTFESTLDSKVLERRGGMTTEPPTNYLSFRVTGEHAVIVPRVREMLQFEKWYIIYLHNDERHKFHLHAICPERDPNGIKRYRNAIRKVVGNNSGNYSFKSRQNGVLQGIQYCGHENTEPITKGDVKQWIDDAPAWVEYRSTTTGKRKRNTMLTDIDGEEFDAGIPVNKYNLVVYAFQFWKKNSRDKTVGLDDIYKQMFKTGKYNWFFTEQFSSFHFAHFRMLIDPDMLAKNWDDATKNELLVEL